MQENKKVSTIIVTWNSKKFIDKCITSLTKSSLLTNIIVVDNNSADGTDKYVKEKYPFITVIQSGGNLGFGGGVNIGIKEAIKQKSLYAFLLNPDAYVATDCIKKLVTEADKNKNIGMASPKIYYAQPDNKLWFAGSKIDWIKGFTPHVGESEIDEGQYDKKCSIDRVCGCAVLIRLSCVKKVGFIDESYFLYYEETDYSMRFAENNFEMIFVPEAICWHNISSSSGGYFSPLYQYYMTRNNLIFMNKYGRKYFHTFIYHFTVRSLISALRNLKKNPKQGIIVTRSIIKGIVDYSKNKLGEQKFV